MNEKQLVKFWDKIDKTPSCWIWKGTKNRKGYGMFTVNKKSYRASRLSYMLSMGEFNIKLLVCHKCDNTSCVNPSHLFLGTAKDNWQDMVSKGRENRARGERINTSKLKKEDIGKIRQLLSENKTHREIAIIFKVSAVSITKIANKKSWKHL